MASTRRSRVTIIREYDTNNIDIEQKPAPKRQDTSEEVTIESINEVTPQISETKNSNNETTTTATNWDQ